MKHLFADGAYDRLMLTDKAGWLDFVSIPSVDLTTRKGSRYRLPPVVERTFGWMTRRRRLVRDDEQRIDVSRAMIFVAMGGNLLRRTAHP